MCWSPGSHKDSDETWQLKNNKGSKGNSLQRPGRVLLFSHVVVSDSLWPNELQHAGLPSPSLSLRVCSCLLSSWCHPTISSSVCIFSSHPQSFPALGSFPRSGSSHQVAKVLELQLQHQSFQWIFRESDKWCLCTLPLSCSRSLVTPWKELPHTPGAPAFVATSQKAHSLLNLPAVLSMGLEFLIPHDYGSIS